MRTLGNTKTMAGAIVEGEKVVANWICHGIHTGELHGISPTGKELTWTGSPSTALQAARSRKCGFGTIY